MLRRTAFFCSLLILFTAAFSWAQIAPKDWTPRSPLEIPTSLHSYVISSRRNAVHTSFYSDSCVEAVKKHIANGSDFRSRVLESPRFSSLMTAHPSQDVRGRKLYHYSRSPSLQTIARDKTYDEIFNFLRNNKNSSSVFLYVAADSESSNSFGHIQVEFKMSASAKIYYPHGVSNERVNIGDREVVNELIQKYPALQDCYSISDSASLPTMLVMLAAEASRIDLIAYSGIENRVRDFAHGSNWFWLMNSWSIVDSK